MMWRVYGRLVHRVRGMISNMNPKVTPEIRAALNDHPVGPVPLDDEATGETVFVVRMSDLTHLQSAVGQRIRDNLAEADADIAANRVGPLDAADIKRRGRERLEQQQDKR